MKHQDTGTWVSALPSLRVQPGLPTPQGGNGTHALAELGARAGMQAAQHLKGSRVSHLGSPPCRPGRGRFHPAGLRTRARGRCEGCPLWLFIKQTFALATSDGRQREGLRTWASNRGAAWGRGGD